MKIRLIDIDSTIPNIALMKISTYHKQKGDEVDWYNPIFDMFNTNLCYASKIFTFTSDYLYFPNCEIIKGGTGYDANIKLPPEVEECDLDYNIYPNCDYSLQFLSRGCIRNCSFCVVPQKEGLISKVKPMNLNPKGNFIILLDNNFFACKEWRENIDILRNYNQPINFNQGIDLRILNEEQCKTLLTLKIKNIHCAWDNYEDKNIILPKLQLLCKHVKSYKITCYILVGFKQNDIIMEDLERVQMLKNLGINPFAMGYIDFNNPNFKKSKSVKDFCRWINMKAAFKSCTWEEYIK